jgi:phage terminase large subunit-like protein
MTEKEQAPRSEGTVSESNELVSGSGGPDVTEGGVMPGGDEMESWKKVNPNLGDTEESLQEQAENLRDRVENS